MSCYFFGFRLPLLLFCKKTKHTALHLKTYIDTNSIDKLILEHIACCEKCWNEPEIDKDLGLLECGRNACHHMVIVANLAFKYFISPAATVPNKWLFSLSGHVANKKLVSLPPDNINRLVFLRQIC